MPSIRRGMRGPGHPILGAQRFKRRDEIDAVSRAVDGPRSEVRHKEPLPDVASGGRCRRSPWSLNLMPSSACGDTPATEALFRRRGWLRKHPKTGEEMGYFETAKERKRAMKELNARNKDGWKRDPTV